MHISLHTDIGGRLEVNHIYALDLTKSMNLIVLSACQTQLSEPNEGNESDRLPASSQD